MNPHRLCSQKLIASQMFVQICRIRWPCSLRRRSAATWLQGSRVRILLTAWIFVWCVFFVFFN